MPIIDPYVTPSEAMRDEPLLVHSGELIAGTVVERPNRFVLVVEFPSETARVFLGDPGALAVLSPGKTVLCSPVDDPDRKTDFDAIAVRTAECYVSLRAALANDLFDEVLRRDILPEFRQYSTIAREPPLPDHGRTDFRLKGEEAPTPAYVEVKSCTHADTGIAKFPDRPTERGRRHLRSLASLTREGYDCHVVFVVQRPDVTAFRPFRKADPEFADQLKAVHQLGVDVHALVIEFDPPTYYLRSSGLPIGFESP